jgi:hypothetical protein
MEVKIPGMGASSRPRTGQKHDESMSLKLMLQVQISHVALA